ncbi:conserved hypothetical protein [Nitrosococcus halophilus Nc 4]|uniref:DUF4007 domain-containing protein n=1 Tax=Nitrosococcus halophilus (strain Nc4) TaxID=472759 RepID=D5C4B8_NITHN|nr:DUF4007 family protein [Nitrosococcus halophilus]ADE13306.1 conserved hypothetical protein [Nitrosococcus halophilus Nc 4]
MARRPLYQSDYRPQFSGHETFPLRYGWLKKAFDTVAATENKEENKSVFLSDDAIARFGVGKNMVASIRHWATAANVLENPSNGPKIFTTRLGRKIFADRGLDPFMEHPTTLWVIHWHLASYTEKTTWFWAFNYFHSATFDRNHLVQGLEKLCKDRTWSRVATTTLKRDVECFVRTYVARPSLAGAGHEETLESPLTELGLIKPIGRREGFRFVRGAKPNLGKGMFLYALTDFWRHSSTARTLSFENIAHEPGSPGRVLLLDEFALAERLSNLEEASGGIFRWSETTGLKQVLRQAELTEDLAFSFMELDYPPRGNREAA